MSSAKPLALGWCEVAISAVAEINPSNPSSQPADEAVVSFVPMAAVEAMTGRMDATESRPWQQVRKGYTRFQEADVLFAKITPCMENGKAAIARGLIGGVGTGSTEFHVLRTESALRPEILLHYILREEFRKSARDHMSGTAGQLRVPSRFLADETMPIPPAGEQDRIVEAIESYFTRLDDAVATLERVQRNLKRYRTSVLKAAVEGRLVPTEAELARSEGRDYESGSVLLERLLVDRRRRWEEVELAKMNKSGNAPRNDGWKTRYEDPAPLTDASAPSLPEGWVWTSADAVGDILLGRQRAPQFLTGNHTRPYLRVANIKDDRIDLSSLEQMDFDAVHFEKYQLVPGDILVSEGQSPELLGQSAIYRGGTDGLCFQKTLHRFRPVAGGPSSEFAQLVFRSHVKSGVFKQLGSITTNIGHLTLVKFKGSCFPLPPADEQARITREAQRILSIIDELEIGIRAQQLRCTRLRQSILKWAFEGRLVDQDPTDEPADVLLERIRAEREHVRADQPERAGRRSVRRARRE